ncbi:phage tail tip lysozyme [Listeria booriae]|uniref:C40 family peptidase n=1 Tax=Listeria booriae TaxID=1552123 RepID=A0A842F0C6_9LIST|nr:phage tail tip lysozyme [Listeria booriae]MBC2242228.1 C40 family peptidase [Listeria booriae]
MKIYKKTTIFLTTISLLTLVVAPYPSQANFEGYKQKCGPVVSTAGKDEEQNVSDSSSSTTATSGGDWTKKGTGANKVAIEIWDYWKSKGFGGPAISGVLGNIAHEGGFEMPDRAEGHYGDDPKENSISEGVVPLIGGPQYPIGKTGIQEGGAGLYQFTPYSKFAMVGDAKWKSVKAQGDFVWTSEVQKAKWLSDYIQISSVEDAVSVWFAKYERGASLNPAKIESGKKAYTLFGGSNIDADSALANAVDTATTGEEKDQESKKTSYGCAAVSDGGDTQETTAANGEAKGIIEKAMSLVGYFTYAMVHGESYIGSVENPLKGGMTDCSGFVWIVLSQAGYKVPDGMGWFTGSMLEDTAGAHNWFNEVKPEDAKAGDIVIVTKSGETGHTAILLEDWKKGDDGANDTKIIQMGGSSTDGVNISKFNVAFKRLLSGNNTVKLARPIKK